LATHVLGKTSLAVTIIVFHCHNLANAILGEAWAVAEVDFIGFFGENDRCFDKNLAIQGCSIELTW
jgi:hypothetical protein